jgi:hypothetical protein
MCHGAGVGNGEALPDVSFAFDAGVAGSLKGNSPRRQIRLVPPREAVTRVMAIAGDFESALGIFHLHSLQQIRRFLERFSQRSPNIAVNSFLHLHLLVSPPPSVMGLWRGGHRGAMQVNDLLLGQLSVPALVGEHMVAFGVPPSVTTSEPGAQFIHWVARPVYDSLRLLLSNRSRQRGRLEVQFQDLAIIQAEAGARDAEFRERNGLDRAPHFLLSWVMDETLRAMQHYLFLGLELELYGPEEADCVLWYLDRVIMARLNMLVSMQQTKAHMEEQKRLLEEEEERRRPGGRKKKKNKGKKKEEEPEDDSSNREDGIELNIQRMIVLGGQFFLAALAQATGRVKKDWHFISWSEMFFHRFRPFAMLQHPMLHSFEDFEKVGPFSCRGGMGATADNAFRQGSPAMGKDVPELLEEAEACFRMVKIYVERGMAMYEDEEDRQLLKNLQRVSVANLVSVAQAKTRLKADHSNGALGKTECPVLSFAMHRFIPVINVVSKGS